jgi:transposase
MIRMMLSDAQWDRIEPLLPGKAGDPGRSGTDNRLFLEAVLWLVRTGVPWRDLPEAFGRWNTVFRRFRRWAGKGVFESIFTALSGDPDFEYALVDGTIVRVHQHGAGAKGGTHTQAIGRSRGGLTTKIVALVDALGNLARFVLLPGQRNVSTIMRQALVQFKLGGSRLLWGGLIHTAVGLAGGSGGFLTKRSGLERKARSSVLWRAAWTASTWP